MIRNKVLFVLLLCLPSACYVAWQLLAAPGRDILAAAAPAEKGLPPAADLARARESAGSLRAGIERVAGAVARLQLPEDGNGPKEVASIEASLRDYLLELADLDEFLNPRSKHTGEERPYRGKQHRKKRYADLDKQLNGLRSQEGDIDEWFSSATKADGAAAAKKRLAELLELLKAYCKDHDLADNVKADNWDLKGRMRLMDELVEWAKPAYQSAVRGSLEPSSACLEAVREILQLADDVKRKKNATSIDERARREADRLGAVAEDWQARLELLRLFGEGKNKVLAAPDRASAWFAEVRAQYDRTKDKHVHALIRDKVTEFCSAFIPAKLRLDSIVLFDGSRASRAQLKIIFLKTGIELRFTDDPDGENEFSIQNRTERINIKWNGAPLLPKDVSPTPASSAAQMYRENRKNVSAWSLATAEELKKACEGKSDLLKNLKDFSQPPSAAAADVGKRLSAVIAAMRDHGPLFLDAGP